MLFRWVESTLKCQKIWNRARSAELVCYIFLVSLVTLDRYNFMICERWMHMCTCWHHLGFVLAPSPMHHRTTYFWSLTDVAWEDLSQSVSRLKTAVLNDKIVLLWEVWSGSSYNRTRVLGPWAAHSFSHWMSWDDLGLDLGRSWILLKQLRSVEKPVPVKMISGIASM